jgi:hypothetical protein
MLCASSVVMLDSDRFPCPKVELICSARWYRNIRTKSRYASKQVVKGNQLVHSASTVAARVNRRDDMTEDVVRIKTR